MSDILVLPTGGNGGGSEGRPTTDGAGAGAGAGTGGSGGSGGGGGGGGFPSWGSQQRKARKRYFQQAADLQLQIDAVQAALSTEFKSALKRRLRNIGRSEGAQTKLLLGAYEERANELIRSSENNENATADSSFANLSNAGRERANAMQQATQQGAGESDLLAAQQMSLRAWASNQGEITRAGHDSATSIAGAATDLRADTRTALVNNSLEANGDREQLWNDYYDQREQALVQIGNLYGQQAELYGYAEEAGGGKKARRKRRKVRDGMAEAFEAAGDASGDAWRNPGADKALLKWQGKPIPDSAPRPQGAMQAPVSLGTVAPEGATLREW